MFVFGEGIVATPSVSTGRDAGCPMPQAWRILAATPTQCPYTRRLV